MVIALSTLRFPSYQGFPFLRAELLSAQLNSTWLYLMGNVWSALWWVLLELLHEVFVLVTVQQFVLLPSLQKIVAFSFQFSARTLLREVTWYWAIIYNLQFLYWLCQHDLPSRSPGKPFLILQPIVSLDLVHEAFWGKLVSFCSRHYPPPKPLSCSDSPQTAQFVVWRKHAFWLLTSISCAATALINSSTRTTKWIYICCEYEKRVRRVAKCHSSSYTLWGFVKRMNQFRYSGYKTFYREVDLLVNTGGMRKHWTNHSRCGKM